LLYTEMTSVRHPSWTCLGAELTHVPLNAVSEARRRLLVEEIGVAVKRSGVYRVVLEPADDGFGAAELELELGDRFGPSWEITHEVRLTTG
jgi:hypothetical protein